MMSQFLGEIEAFLAAYPVSPTSFGVLALGDRSFVKGMRAGRDPRLNTVERVRAWMASYIVGHEAYLKVIRARAAKVTAAARSKARRAAIRKAAALASEQARQLAA